MLTKQQLYNFFDKNNLSLDEDRDPLPGEIQKLIDDSNNIAESFGVFILNSVFNYEKDKINIYFESYEDLYNCYISWMVGYMQNIA